MSRSTSCCTSSRDCHSSLTARAISPAVERRWAVDRRTSMGLPPRDGAIVAAASLRVDTSAPYYAQIAPAGDDAVQGRTAPCAGRRGSAVMPADSTDARLMPEAPAGRRKGAPEGRTGGGGRAVGGRAVGGPVLR